jgi:hypothetical protein
MVGDRDLDFFDGRKLTSLVAPTLKKLPAHWLQRRKASQALALATFFGADALVFSCDIDKGHGKHSDHERRKRLEQIRQSIREGFQHACANDADATRVLTAVAVPARMIEAWALGDREALADQLGVEAGTLDYNPPEELWGDGRDPYSNHPKCTWSRVTDGNLTLAEIGDAADPGVLRDSCPDSFSPFAADVDAAMAKCSASPSAPTKFNKKQK